MSQTILRRVIALTIIFFVIDHILIEVLPISLSKSGVVMIPCLGYMMFCMNCFIYQKRECLIYAVITGALYSIIYVDTLLIYVIIFAIIAYFMRKITNYISYTYIEVLVLFVLTIFFKELVVYLFTYATNQTAMGMIPFLSKRVLPTITFNIVVSYIVYFTHIKVFHVRRRGGNDVYKGEG